MTSLPCLNDTYVSGKNALDLDQPTILIYDNYSHRKCSLPQYISLAAAFTFFSISVFLRYVTRAFRAHHRRLTSAPRFRLSFLIKTALAVLMSAIFAIYVQLTHISIFECYDQRVGSTVPQNIVTLLRILLFMIAILTHGRQVEWTARLDFLWQLQASHEKREMAVLQDSNKRILYNLLPAHVAAHFLDNQFRGGNGVTSSHGAANTIGQELYHQSYAKVGVMFCSIPNFHEFYTELDGNQLGVECLRLLNEIIADFDNLLTQDKFAAIDKIKTVGSTYMAAVGLIPDYKMNPNDAQSIRRHMTTLIEFAQAMRSSIRNINENSYNNFITRIGEIEFGMLERSWRF